jgi:hypothetical protein
MKCAIEHWRDGERIESIDLASTTITAVNGVARVIFPPGMIVLDTGDELRFNPQGLVDFLLQNVR